MQDYIQQLYSSFLKNINNFVSDRCIDMFMGYCKLVTHINRRWATIYNNNYVFRNIVNTVNYSGKYILSILFQSRIEPMETNWISVSILNKTEYNYNEMFSQIDPDETHSSTDAHEPSETDAIIQYKDWYEITVKLIVNSSDSSAESGYVTDHMIEECLLTMKYKEAYIYRIYFKYKLTQSIIEGFEPSTVRFLSIEYINPNNKAPIILTLDAAHFYCGNEILSKLFVKRMIEYQVGNYMFNQDYYLKIMDNNIETFELKSNGFILLEKDEYKICL